MSDNVHKGGCACGKVRFEARGEPYRVGVCHCLTCRKAHGAPFGFFAVFPTEAVTVEGDVLLFESSEKGRRYACPSCGAPVYSSYGRPDEIYLYPGSFDETGLWQPQYELWTIRREPWLPEFPSVVRRYDKERPQWKRTESE
ncbi:MAG: GFA family protein [Methyloceanibacter sp.]|uniref:GFA family protein n=1 Tax=Methyloceanibacter sp. TaxID=1965321 RepID=UPI003D6D9ACC